MKVIQKFGVSLVDEEKGYYFRVDVEPHHDGYGNELSAQQWNLIETAIRKILGSEDSEYVKSGFTPWHIG